MNEKPQRLQDESLCVVPGRHDPSGAITPPIYQSATFRFKDTAEAAAVAAGESDAYIYTRYTNPTLEAAEVKLARLEQGTRALLFGSGSAATATWCHAFLKSGDTIVAAEQLYGGTAHYFDTYLRSFGITIRKVNFDDLEAVEQALSGARACWFETPTNPTVRIVDGPAVAALCRRHGVLSCVDNTFATPINQKPLTWGIDWVMHSATKYFGGHADVMGGVLVVGETGTVEPAYHARLALGGVIDPQGAFLIDRGIKTLALRVERSNANAQVLAEWLSGHDKISAVHYPGLTTHPGHALAKAQMKHFGAILTITLKDGYDAAARFVDSLLLVNNAASLGGVESLVSLPVLTSHTRASAAELATAAITRGTVRMSVGIEALEDLRADIEQALKEA